MIKLFFLWTGTINARGTLKFLRNIEEICTREIEEIYIAINSNGGNIACARMIYNFLESLPCRKITCNIGKVESSAVLLYLAGDERLCVPGSFFTVHSPERRYDRVMNISAIRTELAELELESISLAAIYERKTKLTREEWGNFLRSDKIFIDIDNAKKMGITTGILENINFPEEKIIIITDE